MPDLRLIGAALLVLALAGAAAWLWHAAGESAVAEYKAEQEYQKAQRDVARRYAARQSAAQKAATEAHAAARAAEVAAYGATDPARADCLDDAGLVLFNAPPSGLRVPDR